MAIRTGSTYISDSMKDITWQILLNSDGKSGVSTTSIVKKLTPGDCDDDRQPEVAMWPTGPQNRKCLYIWNCGRQDESSNGKLWVFNHAQIAETDRATTTDNRKLRYGGSARQSCNFWQSVVVTIIWLIFCQARHHQKSWICHWNWQNWHYLSQLQRCNYFWFWVDTSSCRSLVVPTCQYYFTPIHHILYQ